MFTYEKYKKIIFLIKEKKNIIKINYSIKYLNKEKCLKQYIKKELKIEYL